MSENIKITREDYDNALSLCKAYIKQCMHEVSILQNPNREIIYFDISIRSLNLLMKIGINPSTHSLVDLSKLNIRDISSHKGIGKATLIELATILGKNKLKFRDTKDLFFIF